VLRVFAVDRAVLELDPGELALARPLVRPDPAGLPPGRTFLDELVVDALVVERLLDTPARMGGELRPHPATTMQRNRHQLPFFGRISVTPSRTVSITEVTLESDLTCSLNALIAFVPSSSFWSSSTRPLHSVLSAAM